MLSQKKYKMKKNEMLMWITRMLGDELAK